MEDIQPALGTLPLKDGAAKQSTPAAPKESLPENTKQTVPTASSAATPIPAQSHSGVDKQEVFSSPMLVSACPPNAVPLIVLYNRVYL